MRALSCNCSSVFLRSVMSRRNHDETGFGHLRGVFARHRQLKPAAFAANLKLNLPPH